MTDMVRQKSVLWEAVKGDGWTKWEGGLLGEIRYPPCYRMGNVIRIPWQVGDNITPMEPLLLYRYVCRDGKSYLELTLDKDGNPTINH